MKTLEKFYNSTKEMVDDLEAKQPKQAWQGRCVSDYNSKQRNEWAGCSWEQAVNMMKDGDVEGAALIREAGKISVPKTGGQPVTRLSVRGCLPSVPNYLRGVPTNMIDVKREPRKQPVINLYLNCIISASVSRKDAAEAARKIAGVVKLVEVKGVRVNIFSGMINIFGGTAFSCWTKIKDSSAPLNLVNIAFALTHPAFLRRICFAWIERYSEKYDSGYGWVRSFKQLEQEAGLKYEGVKIDLQEVILDKWSEEKISSIFNQYMKEGK